VRNAETSARARKAGWMLVAAGAFTIVNNYLPGAGHLDVEVLNLLGGAAIALGLLAHVLPWHRWPDAASLVFAPVAFVLIALGNRFGGVSDFSYATYFVLTFTWVGLAFPPRTGWLLALPAAAAYILPGLTTPESGPGSVSSVTVAIPVCVLVAETVARTMRQMRTAAAELTEQKEQSEQQAAVLREAEERFRLAFENAPIGMALVAPDGQFLRVNRSLGEIVGYSAEQLVGKSFQEITYPDDLEADLAYVRRMLAGEIRTYSMDKRYVRASGQLVWVNLSVSLVRDAQGEPLHFISQIEDITQRKRTEAALKASEERTRRILETAGDAFVAIDAGGAITDWNRQAEATFGWKAAEVVGRPLEEVLIPPDLRAAHRQGLAYFLATGEGPILGRRLELTALHRDGRTLPVELVTWALEEDGRWQFNAFLRDISQRKAMEAELERLAMVDDLTGLGNRRGFLAIAEPLVRVAHRSQRDMALLYIDLDNMKAINDRHGHSAGDQALIEIAELLRSTFRDSDIIARLGGDEFCVLLPKDGIEAKACIDRLDERLRARGAETFPPISLSVGVARYHWDDPCSIETLIERADAAMYQAKSEKRTTSTS
jgi:diguanylate cyclase